MTVTLQLSLCLASAFTTLYFAFVAFLIALPSRSHLKAVAVGAGDQEPGLQVSVLPTFAVPATFGFAVFVKDCWAS